VTITTYRRRWSDNDTYFGPFTFALSKKYRSFAIDIRSDDDEERGCRLRFSVGGFTTLLALPGWVLRPARRWVDTSRHEWSKPGGGYWEIIPREYGFSFSDTGMVGGTVALHVHFGRQTHDSSTDQSKCYFLPWTDWRHVRHSLYGLSGEHFADLPEYGFRLGRDSWDRHRAVEESCPTVAFSFKDFDGEELIATTKIEEREWRLGTKWCKWLSWFARPKVHRSLDLRFSGETGERKGSWKGGTIGHSIDMQPGELHEAAFRRYCDAHGMTFIAPA
jgi:hypothetical protein